MPIKVTCACGKNYTVKDALAGKTVRCKGCNEALRIPRPGEDQAPTYESGPYLAQTRTTEETIRCPNCGRSMPKTIETCRNCGKTLRKNYLRVLVASGAGVLAVLLLVVVIVVFILPSRQEIVERRVTELVEYLEKKDWHGIYELDLVHLYGEIPSANYVQRYQDQFAEVEINVAPGAVTIEPGTGSVISPLTVSAKLKGGAKGFRNTFNLEWKDKDGKWYASLHQLFKALTEYVEISRVRPQETCPNCTGSGREACSDCGGTGKLLDQSFCPRCFRSQGWTVCPFCKGTGISVPVTDSE